jgi:hypothetical protein
MQTGRAGTLHRLRKESPPDLTVGGATVYLNSCDDRLFSTPASAAAVRGSARKRSFLF